MIRYTLTIFLGFLIAGAVQAQVITQTHTIQMLGGLGSSGSASAVYTATMTIDATQMLDTDDISVDADVIDNRYDARPLEVSFDEATVTFESADFFVYQNQSTQGLFLEAVNGTLSGTSDLLPQATYISFATINLGAPANVLNFEFVLEPNAPPAGNVLLDALLTVENIYGGGAITTTISSEIPEDILFASITLFPDNGPVLSGTIEGFGLTAIPLPAAWALLGSALGFATLGRGLRRLRRG